MPTFQFNKLVRNKLPVIYEKLNEKIVYRSLQGKELQIALRQKLIEEAAEIPIEDGDWDLFISEISDVEQALDDLKSALVISDEEVNQAKQKKYKLIGGFSDGTFIEQIQLDDNDEWVDYYRAEPSKYPEVPAVASLNDVGNKPTLKPGRYRHYKGGMYVLVDIACHTETLEWYVVYQSEERKKQNLPSVWMRPYDMFIEDIEVDGKQMKRFEKVTD